MSSLQDARIIYEEQLARMTARAAEAERQWKDLLVRITGTIALLDRRVSQFHYNCMG